ncbi:hypothetical protein [Kineosporia sp. NBRC 101731]|uniref:hypothetical protein n=1 Tax=Kineosporia sp. NBRC 101731 TaxID=3032199 RepID=UPI0024A3FDB9|nr:hypothetical protein [Kineosporia sp. NBRC 101731]GLY33426.1 hypothetical protein Kisp02_67910 [Kineosporia sp. NBRC 101731]
MTEIEDMARLARALITASVEVLEGQMGDEALSTMITAGIDQIRIDPQRLVKVLALETAAFVTGLAESQDEPASNVLERWGIMSARQESGLDPEA